MPKLKLAMRIGGEYALGRIAGRHWRRLVEAVAQRAKVCRAALGQGAAKRPG